jgi:2-amino-4-hydroxy-6-hydroxymethyldihydropteridine diphosphokinase
LSRSTESVFFLGLGSNLGDRAAYLRRALAAVRELAHVEAVSRVYESEPVGLREQPDFWNLVVRARTTMEPHALLQRLKDIERTIGRVPAPRNAPRIIDIDLLAYGQCVQHDPELDLPHPRMHERTFVLYPLTEVAPEFRHPESGRSLPELRAQLIQPTRAVPLTDNVLEDGE